VVPRSVVVVPMNGLALVAMVFSSMPGSMRFGFFGFAFFGGDFGAELGVFFVFDRAAGFFAFAFGFFSVFDFVVRFRFVFFRGRGGEVPRGTGRARRLCRGGAGQQREQQQDEEERKELAHRPFIGAMRSSL
jgi:hypothetical protein